MKDPPAYSILLLQEIEISLSPCNVCPIGTVIVVIIRCHLYRHYSELSPFFSTWAAIIETNSTHFILLQENATALCILSGQMTRGK